MSPSPPIYEPYKKPYFTIADLYIRYAPLSKFQIRNKVTRIITILFIISMQNLYEKFHNKEKLIIFTSNKPFKQHATRQNLEYVVFERFGFIRSLSQELIVQ